MTKELHHHLLICQDERGDISAKYSRCPAELVAPNAPADGAWNYYRRQVNEAFAGWRLLAVVDDERHDHPMVLTACGYQDPGDRAHMP